MLTISTQLYLTYLIFINCIGKVTLSQESPMVQWQQF